MTLVDECDATVGDGAAGNLLALAGDLSELLGVLLVGRNEKTKNIMHKQIRSD